MKKIKIFVSLLLVASFLMATAMPIGAARVTYYLSDLKLAEADSAEEAKKLLTDAGYTVFDKNLNPGGEKVVYIGYKKSKNVDDAITDVRIMNMNGGFDISSYDAVKQDAIAEYGPTIDRFRIAAKEFAENYKAGKREAQIAYRQLNYYYVEVNKVKTKMGDYMLNFPEKNDGFAEILFMGNPIILDNIRNLLAMGVSDGGALIERIKAAVNDESVYGKKEYWEDAKLLVNKGIQLKKILNENYDRINEITNDTTLTEEEREAALVIPRYNYTLVSAFDEAMAEINTKDGSNYSAYFDKVGITDYSALYPFVEAMTPGQKAMAVSGQFHSVLVYNTVEMTDDEIEAELSEIEEGFNELPVTLGTNMDLVEGSLGVTSEAIREQAATGNDWFACFTGNMAADIVISALFGAGGATIVGISARYLSSQWDNGYFAQVVAQREAIYGNVAKEAQSTSSVSSTELSPLGTGFAIFGVFIGCVMVIFSIISIKEIINKYKVEYTDIPANMVDVVSTVNGNRYVNYKVVNSLYKDGDKTKERAGDTNAYDGSQWNAIYYTKSYEAGKCMTANVYDIENASDYGKYTPAAKFGSTLCYNLNSFNGNENNEAIYLAFGNSNNKKTAETSVPTVVGSIYTYGAMAISGVIGFALGAGVMIHLKRKKQEEPKA